MKNQMETMSASSVPRKRSTTKCLPENNIQHEENYGYHSRPEKRLLIQRNVSHGRDLGQAVDQAGKLPVSHGFGGQTYGDGHSHTHYKRPQRLKHVLCQTFGVGRERHVAKRRRIDFHPRPHTDRRERSAEQSPKASRAGGALP